MRSIIILALLVNSLVIGTTAQVLPKKIADTKYTFEFSNVYFEVDPVLGGRIKSLKIDSNELLYVDFNTNNAGSTFWLSPQSGWKWPPSPEIDNLNYSANISNDQLILKSSTDKVSGLNVIKVFSINTNDTSIAIQYIVKNDTKTNCTQAPWEITRVSLGGLTFFPRGDTGAYSNMSGSTIEINNYIWYDQKASASNPGVKFYADGMGWIAHAVDGYILVKSFPNIAHSMAAPNESEIEVYTDPKRVYTELENQGAYTSINSGDSLVWTVKWFVRKLPSNVNASIGNKLLVEYVEKLVDSSKYTQNSYKTNK
jgi:hypothetical protein